MRFYNEDNKIITSIGANENSGFLSLNELNKDKTIDSSSVWIDGNGFGLKYNEEKKIALGIVDKVSLLHIESVNNENYTQIVQKDSSSAIIVNHYDYIKNSLFYDVKYAEAIFSNEMNIYDMFCRYDSESNEIRIQEIFGTDSNNITKHVGPVTGNYIYQSIEGKQIASLGYTLLDGIHLNLSSNEGWINLGSRNSSAKFGLEINYDKKDILTKSELFLGHFLEIPEEETWVKRDDKNYNLISTGMFFNINEKMMYKNLYSFDESFRLVSWSSIESGLIGLGFGKTTSLNLYDEKRLRYSTSLWGENKISTDYYDENGKLRLSLGNQLLEYTDGSEKIFPASSIHLFNENGNVIEQLPR